MENKYEKIIDDNWELSVIHLEFFEKRVRRSSDVWKIVSGEILAVGGSMQQQFMLSCIEESIDVLDKLKHKNEHFLL